MYHFSLASSKSLKDFIHLTHFLRHRPLSLHCRFCLSEVEWIDGVDSDELMHP